MIFLDRNVDYTSRIIEDVNDEEKQEISAEEKMQLIARATLDRRLNARDLKLYNYVMSFEYLSCTQEEISELLDLSRSNINKSLEKLASFNYIEKVQLKKGIKKMAYKLKGLNRAGIVKPNECEVVRVLNVSNITDTKYKFIYCSPSEVSELEQLIKEYKKNVDVIEEYYDSNEESLKKREALSLVETFDPYTKSNKDVAIQTLKELIKEFEERISDTVTMRRKLNGFLRNFESKILGKDDTKRVLADANARFILFMDKNEDEYLTNFKEKYLENYIKFVCKFSDLDENSDFFKIYYEDKKLKFTFTQLMRMIGRNHREVPEKRKDAIDFITGAIEDFGKGLDNIELTDGASALVQEVSDLLEVVTSKAVFSSREVALLLFVLDGRYSLEKNIGLDYDSFVELYNPDLFEMFAEYETIKEEIKLNKELDNESSIDS